MIPLLCPVGVSPTYVSQADDLINRSYALTADWLAQGPVDLDTMLTQAVHAHDATPPA